MTKRRNPMVGVRVSTADLARIDALAQERGCSRCEAVRIALTIGLPLAHQAMNLNISRIAALLEFAAAGIGVMIWGSHPDYEEDVKRMVQERVERFHK